MHNHNCHPTTLHVHYYIWWTILDCQFTHARTHTWSTYTVSIYYNSCAPTKSQAWYTTRGTFLSNWYLLLSQYSFARAVYIWLSLPSQCTHTHMINLYCFNLHVPTLHQVAKSHENKKNGNISLKLISALTCLNLNTSLPVQLNQLHMQYEVYTVSNYHNLHAHLTPDGKFPYTRIQAGSTPLWYQLLFPSAHIRAPRWQLF